ncbi:unnamed protein product [Taenia asiatica]|uniref:Peptidase S1 domain-containing protein n=1 Tax=Taenia asiatica TaxID=60517 RepID=A0A0R3VV16_TAEAS|nr:unnamed protein product [Taenia asiatica]
MEVEGNFQKDQVPFQDEAIVCSAELYPPSTERIRVVHLIIVSMLSIDPQVLTNTKLSPNPERVSHLFGQAYWVGNAGLGSQIRP